jgi:hypothetical protein
MTTADADARARIREFLPPLTIILTMRGGDYRSANSSVYPCSGETRPSGE